MARLKNISRAREEVLALSIWKDHRSQLVLQRQFKAGTSDMRAKRTDACWALNRQLRGPWLPWATVISC